MNDYVVLGLALVAMFVIGILSTGAHARPHGGGHGGGHAAPPINVNYNTNHNSNYNHNSNSNTNTNNNSAIVNTPAAVVSGGGPVVSTVRRPMPSDGFRSPDLPTPPPEVINPYTDWIAGSPLPPYEVKCGDGTILRAPRGSSMAIFKCPDGSKITMFN